MNFSFLHKSDLDTDLEVLVNPASTKVADKEIVLYNDDVNSFDFVIETLIKVCKHDSVQAEQCTYLVHYKGKCSVKKGSYEDLKPVCSALLDRGLSAQIE